MSALRLAVAALAALSLGTLASAQEEAMPTAVAVLKHSDGAEIGSATLTDTPAGVLIRAEISNLPRGAHGFHLHERGVCEPPFESAGEHFNPMRSQHGLVTGGPHAGDMPNIEVPETGSLTIEVLNASISLEDDVPETLFDDDGTALMIHADADDYRSQPSGEAGDRIACGVVERVD